MSVQVSHPPTGRIKKPDRCPLCGTPRPIKKGTRAKKLATVQRYQCRKPIAQLTIYALALARLAPGLRLFDVKCAFFNENVYNEFFPRTALKRTR